MQIVRVLVVTVVLGGSVACQQQPPPQRGEKETPTMAPARQKVKREEGTRVMGPMREKVKQIIVEQLGVDEAEVTDTASFVDDLGADSLDIVELVMALEEAFSIEIADEDVETISTFKDVVEYIEKKKK